MASIFEVDENGQITYEPSESEVNGSYMAAEVEADASASDSGTNEAQIVESEVLEDGNNVIENVDTGNILPDALESEEILAQTSETGESGDGGSNYSVSLLSDEVETTIVEALTPASGSLGSTTLDYFDRIVSSLPSDCAYVAYRTNSDNSYDAVLYYGDDYEFDGTTLSFGDGARQIHVERTSNSSYSAITEYYEYGAEDTAVNLSKSGDVIYYSNADVGFPLLGGIVKPFDISPFIAVGLLSAMAVAVLQKVFLRK